IHKQNVIPPFDCRPMRMAADDDMHSIRWSPRFQFLHIMQHVNGYCPYMHGLGFWDPASPRFSIVIAAHGHYRRKYAQAVKHRATADVTGMQDETHVFENTRDLRPQQSMSVRDDAN